jgi:hypothetical protein
MPPAPMIPVWFYGFDAIMYFVSAIVGLLLSFYLYKIYSLSSERRHLYLFAGFLIISTALLCLSVSDAYSYISFWQCRPMCVLGILNQAFNVSSLAYFAYFGLSLMAYSLFMIAYLPKNFKLPNLPFWLLSAYFFVILVSLPFNNGMMSWQSYSGFFDLIAFLMLIFVSFMNVLNYDQNRNMDSLLVTGSFFLLSLFHVVHIFSQLNEWMYVLAHLSLLASFSVLLFVMVKVKGR